MRTLVVDHPLVTHKLTALRDVASDTATFRSLTAELVTLLAYEATREIRVQPTSVTTPVGVARGAGPCLLNEIRVCGRAQQHHRDSSNDKRDDPA